MAGDCGYAHVAAVTRVTEPGPRFRWEKDGARLDLFLPVVADEEILTGAAPANPASEQLSLAIRRRRAAKTTFLAVLVPTAVGNEPTVGVRWPTDEGTSDRCEVETARGVERWVIARDLTTIRLTTQTSSLEIPLD